jgi:hypothetical protein
MKPEGLLDSEVNKKLDKYLLAAKSSRRKGKL